MEMETCITMEPGYFEFEDHAFFDIDDPVYVLGKKFNARQDLDEIKHFIRSRLWFTYRRNFQPIGGTGPTSDQGWGCMLRCGQMLLAQALIVRHLGRDWTWKRENKEDDYWSILRLFQDKKSSMFSLHQIAQMGVSEGKPIGEWFGPNTVAQVLKKLVIYDDWSKLVILVAMDNLVIRNDIVTLAHTQPRRRIRTESDGVDSDASEVSPIPQVNCQQSSRQSSSSVPTERDSGGQANSQMNDSAASASNAVTQQWRPVLLVVPLRLGLTVMNQCYLDAIKEYFALPYCVGILGGRPNHALFFVGIVGSDLLYLDPHECQNAADLPIPQSTHDDVSYHCPFLLHMPFENVDPSLALSFLCLNNDEFDDLTRRLRDTVLKASNPPLFELLDERPKGFPKFVPYVGEEAAAARIKEFMDLGDAQYDSDEEFELLQ